MTRMLRLFEKPNRWIWLVVFINFGGVIYGWYYYEYQLLSSPIYLWIFIADCPNAALMVAIALILMLKNRKNDFVSFFASCNALKYGIWTCFVILLYCDYFLSPERRLLYSCMFVSHALLALEAIPLAYTVEFDQSCFMVLLWLLLNDFMDYVVGTHPYMPLSKLKLVAGFTVFLSFFSFCVCYSISRKKRAAAGI